MRARPALLAARLFAAAVLLAAAGGAAAQAGRVVLAVGEVAVQRGAERLRISAGVDVTSGDTVFTGAQSHAQIRFADNALVALKPDTEFRIEQFVFSGRNDGSERAVFRLVRGGFRTLTGQIGQVDRETYRVLTTQATIGIRGTHYLLQVCAQDECRDSPTDPFAPAGLYGGVLEGRIAVTTPSGEVEYGEREYLYVPDGAAPLRLIAPPGFLADRLQGRPVYAERRAPTERKAPADLTFPKVPEFPLAYAKPDAPFVYQATEDLDNGPVLETGPITPANRGYAIGSDRYTLELGTTTSGDSRLGVDGDGQLRSVRTPSLTANVGTANIVDTGRDATATGLNWGRWAGAGSTIAQTVPGGEVIRNDGGNLHYVYGTLATSLPTSGTVTFAPLGGTRPTDSGTGATGTLISAGSVSVDFTAARLALSGLAIGFGSATYTMSGATSLVGPLFSTAGVGAGAGCTGQGCQPLVQGNFAGFLAGPGATGVGLDYYFNTRSGGVIEGAAAYRRCPGTPGC